MTSLTAVATPCQNQKPAKLTGPRLTRIAPIAAKQTELDDMIFTIGVKRSEHDAVFVSPYRFAPRCKNTVDRKAKSVCYVLQSDKPASQTTIEPVISTHFSISLLFASFGGGA